MKNIQLGLISLLLSLQLNAQSREVKLDYAIVEPAEWDVFSSPQEMPISFRLYNRGPDTLWTCDTLGSFIDHSLMYPFKQEVLRVALREPIYPNDSSELYRDTSFVDWPKDFNDVKTMVLSLVAGIAATDYSHPKGSPLYNEIGDQQTVRLLHKRSTASAINQADITPFRFYPNPLAGGSSLSLQGLDNETVRMCYIADANGRVTYLELPQVDDSGGLHLKLGTFISGLYFICVITDTSKYSEKLIIE